jgi:MFS transporter, PHS family, inorganic phosphate transporter
LFHERATMPSIASLSDCTEPDFTEMDNAPLSSNLWKIMFISGMGFFTDAYDLFIIGIVMTLIKSQWHITPLEESLVNSTALLSSALGALLFGRIADMLGRKRIYGFEVLVLAAGAFACSFAPNILWLIGLRFILGIGIGGDYPVSATIMSEYACKQHRGLLVSLVFSMQAAGLIIGPLFAAALLSTGLSHDLIWRILVGAGAIPPLAVYWQRRKLRETPRFLSANNMVEDEAGKIVRVDTPDPANHSISFWDGFHRLVTDETLLPRLIGASGAWFLMDAAYYGNTVSSPLVLSALAGHPDLRHKALTQLLIFVVFAAPGYVVAALTMDRLGRKTIQALGFAMMAVAFALMALIPGIDRMTAQFVVIYGLSFFFTEFGPNTTTFVYPSEIFPVRVRTTAHGVAAAMGKLGGFLGVFLFPYLMRWNGLPAAESAAAITSIIGFGMTIFLLPETKGKSLEELSMERPRELKRAA